MAVAPEILKNAQRQLTGTDGSIDEESCVTLHTGSEMPLLGLGTRDLTHHTADSVSAALRAGFRMIDSAPAYHTQRGVGEALRELHIPREWLFVVTTIDASDYTLEAARRNVAELRLEYADLVLMRSPADRSVGESAWQGLRRARRAGVTRDIGVSNYSIEQIEELVYRTGELPAVNQLEWSPFGHSPRMLDFCRDNHIAIQAASPLTGGARLNDNKLTAMAARYGKTPAQLLIRWNLQQGVVPLPKANQAHHQRDNLHVFNFTIAPPDMTRLRALNEHYSASGRLAYL